MNGISIQHQWSIQLQETWSEWLRMIRMPMFALPTLLFPWMFYLFFGVMFGRGTGSAEYLVVTYGAFGVIGPALFGFGVGVASDRQQGLLQLKRVLPMPMSAYFIAKIGICLMFSVLIVTGLACIAMLLGDVRLQLTQWLLLYGVLLVGTLPFCAMGLFIGLRSNSQAAPAIINLLYLPMAFLSGLWIPIFILPELLQKIAVIFPAYHLAQLALWVIDKHQGQPLLGHVLILLLYTGIFLLLAGFAWKKLRDR